MSVKIYRNNGKIQIEFYPKVADNPISFGEPVYLTSAGFLSPYTPGVAAPFLGLCKKAIAATDDDYSDNTRIPVEVGNYDTEYLFDASSTTANAGDVGEYVDYVEATVSVDVGTTSQNDVYITQVISGTLVVGKWARRVTSITSTVE